MIPLSSIKKDQNQQKQISVDLNCDIGQSFGIYKNDLEYALLPFVSSVNISCGSHAGDPVTLTNALKAAKENNLAIGAHIGYPDIQGFGYRAMQLSEEEIEALVVFQIGGLISLAKAHNLEIEHVRPHGALYKQAATDLNVSVNIAKAIYKYNPWLIYIGAAGEILNKTNEITSVRIAPEVHLDKVYNFDGTIDFDSPDVNSIEYATEQLESLLKDSSVVNKQGGKTKLDFKTIHLNMKSEISVEIAKKAKEMIQQPVPVAVTMVANTGWV